MIADKKCSTVYEDNWDELYKDRSPGKLILSESFLFWKSYSLEITIRDSIFREDLFLYNCLQRDHIPGGMR